MKILEAAGSLKKIDENCASQQKSMGISVRRGVECKYVEIVSEVAPDGRKAGGKWTWSKRGKWQKLVKWQKWQKWGNWAEMGRYQTPPLRGAYHTPAWRLKWVTK